MINEKGKCYDCGKEGEGNLCTECFEKNHMINEKPEKNLREILKDIYREGHYQGQLLDKPISFEKVDETIDKIEAYYKPRVVKLEEEIRRLKNEKV